MQIVILVILISAVIYRCLLSLKGREKQGEIETGYGEFVGEQQVQADYGKTVESPAGLFAVLADGIGKEQRGRISARIAVDTMVSLFRDYQVVSNPVYFFRRAYQQANAQILKALDDRPGGACVAGVMIEQNTLYYALAGDIKIALYRKGDLIPLSEGHTLGKLVENAYKQGRLTRQEALAAIKEERLYNYVGQDGFKSLELFDIPVQLQKKDCVLLMTKGIYEALSWKRIEELLEESRISADRQAEKIIREFINIKDRERDNGSVLVLKTRT